MYLGNYSINQGSNETTLLNTVQSLSLLPSLAQDPAKLAIVLISAARPPTNPVGIREQTNRDFTEPKPEFKRKNSVRVTEHRTFQIKILDRLTVN